MAKKSKRRGIQSVEIGLRVLFAVASHPGASTLSAIAKRGELTASQTHRYLTSLIASGVVQQEETSSLYNLGAGAIRLGLAALSRLNILVTADKSLATFSRTTGWTSLISIWGGAGPTIIRWLEGDPPIITSLGIGSVLPLFQSATGRIFYAFGNEAHMDRQGVIQARRLGRPIKDFAEMRIADRQKLSVSIEGDLIPGLRACAAPVFDLQGRLVLVAAATASAVHPKMGDAKVHQGLLDVCRQLTESVGGAWPRNP